MLGITRRLRTPSGLFLGLTVLGLVASACSTAPDSQDGTATSPPGATDGSAIEDRAQVPTAELLGETKREVADAAPAAPPSVASEDGLEAEAYTLAAGDILEFRCFDDDTLSKEIVVRYDGCVSLNLIPDVQVHGITREEAEQLLRDAYSAIFKDPQLSLTVRDSASRVYFVIGDVQSPSEYPYTRRTSILQAINKAGGLRVQYQSTAGGGEYGTGLGSLTKAFVIRTSDAGREVIECDLSGLTNSGPHQSQFALMPDDIVYVPEGVNLVYVIGEVQRPGVFQLTENMTLLRLIAQAGGHVATTARMSHVVLIRETSQETSDVMIINVRELVRTGEDIRLEPGDIVYVPQKPLVRARDFVSRFTGSIAPLLDLYIQGWEAYYAEDRLKAIVDVSQGDGRRPSRFWRAFGAWEASSSPIRSPRRTEGNHDNRIYH